MSIAPIEVPQITGVEPKPAARGVELGEVFGNVLDEARRAEATATDAAEKFARGDAGVGIHEVVIASEKASIAVRYMTTLKTKALEAYRELMNTQV